MKNILMKYIISLLLLLIATGCDDNFLEQAPLDELSNETYWRTETDLKNYNNGLYNRAKDDEKIPILDGLNTEGVKFQGGIWWNDQFSDNLAPTHARSNEFTKIRMGYHVVENNARLQGYNSEGWAFLRAINFGLENYDRAELQEETINKYKGEARLFRGWWYADKVSRFGDMQWIDRSLNIDAEELYAGRDDREMVMDKVLADLDFAVAHLPEDWGDGEDPGRVDKWVALAVKSRICLFEGTWRKYHGGSDPDKWLTECVNASLELMNNGGFTLYNTGKPDEDYRYLLSTQSQVGNPEVIYWRKYEPLINGHFASRLFWNYNGGATKSFVDDVLCEDGLPISLSPLYVGDDSIETTFMNRDLRLRQCVLHPEDQAKMDYARDPDRAYPIITGQDGGGRNRSNTGYHVVKHWNAEDEGSPRDQHNCAPPALRLGETLLNFAEAKAELGTITQADLDMSINLLRERVAMAPLNINPPMDPRYANDGLPSIIIEIRRERRVELFLEGHRYHDLRRWKWGKKLTESDLGIRWDEAAKTRYAGADDNVEVTTVDGVPYIDVRKNGPYWPPVFDENKHYLWPLPVNAISQNPNLGQNPGW
ncbi:RagB/SusD family nutrient uptake outer membrane protein [Flexithrix dorotheae]|uniref:RagB/SusD family nutrient uptake outer membrane protein n=1 Tax=Flexithrix dorotheae TaxID=70993 RepID=UPI00037C541E|nr:RagB/SusD family nutrient uptake outer membrane protein [Flexithrix dorotheae]